MASEEPPERVDDVQPRAVPGRYDPRDRADEERDGDALHRRLARHVEAAERAEERAEPARLARSRERLEQEIGAAGAHEPADEALQHRLAEQHAEDRTAAEPEALQHGDL